MSVRSARLIRLAREEMQRQITRPPAVVQAERKRHRRQQRNLRLVGQRGFYADEFDMLGEDARV